MNRMIRFHRRLHGGLLAAVIFASFAACIGGATGDVGQPAAPAYRVVDLGMLPGFATSTATAINASGDVVGYCGSAKGDRAGRQGFLFSKGKMTPVGPILLPKDWTEPRAINASGTVVGDLQHGTRLDGFRLQNGSLKLPLIGAPDQTGTVVKLAQLKPYLVDVPKPAGYHIAAGHINAISDAGTMGGVVEVHTTIALPDRRTANIVIHHAGIIRPQVGGKFTFQDLGALGGKYSDANAINASGVLAGSAELAPNQLGEIFAHACLFDHGKVIDLGTLGGSVSVAFDVNDRGDAVGDAAGKSETARGFYWHAGKMIDLGDIGGGISEALAINNSGLIVGRSLDSTFAQHGCIRIGNRFRDLNSFIPPSSGWVIIDARDINDRGQIAATAIKGGRTHAVILTPAYPGLKATPPATGRG